MKNRQSPPDGHLLGAHMSIAGGTPNAIDRALSVQAQALQIFVKNNNRWQGKILTRQETQAFRTRWQDSGLHSLAAHNAYLINLASPNPRLWRKSIEAMLDELDRCRRLGVPLLVTHPGAHTGSGESEGIRRHCQGARSHCRQQRQPGPHRSGNHRRPGNLPGPPI